MSDEAHSSAPPPAVKKARTIDDDAPDDDPVLDIYQLYEDDPCRVMFSLASIEDLCTLDILCKRLQRTTAHQWQVRTKETFGLNNGKKGWIFASRLLNDPVRVEMIDDGDFGYGAMFVGSPDVATNGSIVAAVTDDTDVMAYDRTFPGVSEAIAIRDASSLNFMRNVPSLIRNLRVAVCGRVGSEIIVTSNRFQIAARRGNDTISFEFDPETEGNGFGLPLIGCETHLIALVGGKVVLYQASTGTDVLFLRHSASAMKDQIYDPNKNPESLCWGMDEEHFVFCYSQTCQISIWKLDVNENKTYPVQAIDISKDQSIKNLVLADNYVAASCEKRKLHIWDRNNKERKHVLCDVGKEDELSEDEDELIYPLCMVPHGHILVSTSHVGHIFCVWNMKTGQLLRRYDPEPRIHGAEVTSMVYMECLNAYICMTSRMVVYCYPISKRQREMVASIKRREQRIKQANRDADAESDVTGDEFY